MVATSQAHARRTLERTVRGAPGQHQHTPRTLRCAAARAGAAPGGRRARECGTRPGGALLPPTRNANLFALCVTRERSLPVARVVMAAALQGSLGTPCDWWKEPCILGAVPWSPAARVAALSTFAALTRRRAGIDEAGRGPVLGPMVYGAAFCAVSYKPALAKAAYADSKALTEERRDALFAQLKADTAMGWIVDSISAEALSTKMLRR